MKALSLARVPIVVMALMLAGCTSGGTFGWPEQYGGQIDSAFNYGAGGRDFSTVVVGNQFGRYLGGIAGTAKNKWGACEKAGAIVQMLQENSC